MKAKKRLPDALDFALVQARRDYEAAKAELDRAISNNAEPKIIAGFAARVEKAAKGLRLANTPTTKKKLRK